MIDKLMTILLSLILTFCVIFMLGSIIILSLLIVKIGVL